MPYRKVLLIFFGIDGFYWCEQDRVMRGNSISLSEVSNSKFKHLVEMDIKSLTKAGFEIKKEPVGI